MVFRVLDATAFYAGIPFSSQDSYYVTTMVYDEIKHIKKNHSALEILLDSKRLVIHDPDINFEEKVRYTAKETGDLKSLSNEDISSISLSLEFNTALISDDFAISNVAKQLGIEIIPLMTKGIKITGKWIHYCPSCETSSSKSICQNCGNKLRRKLISNN